MPTLVCIGGCIDGRRVNVPWPIPPEYVGVNPTRQRVSWPLFPDEITATPVPRHRYLKEQITTQDGQRFYVYRWDGLTQGDVFMELLDNYRGSELPQVIP